MGWCALHFKTSPYWQSTLSLFETLPQSKLCVTPHTCNTADCWVHCCHLSNIVWGSHATYARLLSGDSVSNRKYNQPPPPGSGILIQYQSYGSRFILNYWHHSFTAAALQIFLPIAYQTFCQCIMKLVVGLRVALNEIRCWGSTSWDVDVNLSLFNWEWQYSLEQWMQRMDIENIAKDMWHWFGRVFMQYF